MFTELQKTPLFDMILFGGTGDLVMRKLLPALFEAHRATLLHEHGRIFALGRKQWTTEEYVQWCTDTAKTFIKNTPSQEEWVSFAKRIHYLTLDATKKEDFNHLKSVIQQNHHPSKAIVCYLATAPSLFVPICESLASVGLNHEQVRIVLEKPLGHDLISSHQINEAVAKHFNESQLYRIDHYLGKESVQNLLAIRFGNILFEPLWRREWIDHIQITLAENLGVEGRGSFYDQTGALRDMVQNHLLQLLCVVAMEPPPNLSADAIRDEKLKVLKSLKPFDALALEEKVVRGQYRAGDIDGRSVHGYLNEENIPESSLTETFVAIKAEIDNWRWSGIPFYLRTGKRMPKRLAEIVIKFKDLPHHLFPTPVNCHTANRLVIQLQPDESIRLYFLAKEPGDTMQLAPTYLNLDFHSMFKARRSDAYERLILDVIRGQLSLFMRRDELVAAWEWVTPILDHWRKSHEPPKPYMSGSWGPSSANTLLIRDGFYWHEHCLENNTYYI
jgi:glucose-6-phosphate 1-dehydrogenase